MKTVATILKNKGSEVSFVSPDTMVRDALKIMAEKNIGAIVVMNNTKLVGIFSERDYARKIVLKDKSSKSTAISEIMTSEDLVTVKPSTSIDDCMVLMTERRIRHLPVVENEQLLGVISIGDLVKHIIEDQKITIENLQNYISGQ
ncbi:MAG TPA: CBS domain-containing protein [Bacteroidia bacterium]|mgnify:FL=1|jgi:CBS domain-containing protein|nr:CBS domain-containing protein [Bacteroidota bacterium]MBP6414174.1 CBS domain-containing protein [Bacteroidia bacterium]MBK9673620.1 CBS domain-containing protein [Bacteroidota bacterium]HRH04100.1 CBS domain-containing protein [Bacteroidia bacterium]HRH09787.1 CBS domain-containing protein [Bacteroidia bacterium]